VLGITPVLPSPVCDFPLLWRSKIAAGLSLEKLQVCSRFFNWPEEAGTGCEILAIGEEDKLLTSHFLINSTVRLKGNTLVNGCYGPSRSDR